MNGTLKVLKKKPFENFTIQFMEYLSYLATFTAKQSIINC